MDFLPRVLRRENSGAVCGDKTMARSVIVAQSEVDSHDPQERSVEMPTLEAEKFTFVRPSARLGFADGRTNLRGEHTAEWQAFR